MDEIRALLARHLPGYEATSVIGKTRYISGIYDT